MQIKTVSVIGAGTMGSGIATVSLLSGYEVYLLDIKQEFLDNGKSKIEKALQKSADKGVITEETRLNLLKKLHLSTDYSVVKDSQLIIEAIIENLDVKKKLLTQLSEFAVEDAIIASNTSALSLTDIANFYKKPENVIGMHFFNPPVVMKLVELIKTEQTSAKIFDISKEFVLTLKKEPVEVKESPGFVVNRVLIPMINEAAMVFGEGVSSAEDIDKAMKLGANHPIGPLALADMIGIDVCQAIMETLQRDFNSDKYKPAPVFSQLIKEGNLGKKTGKGFFDYTK
ncbi:MAG: 3-hydroxyacyl-CoA dehydrogenase NAD-binding domain-containing protein [Candidatus Gastranaerophilaceae bacterium]|jgi:3-hydroxybutyryl-CoA dehydrogenase